MKTTEDIVCSALIRAGHYDTYRAYMEMPDFKSTAVSLSPPSNVRSLRIEVPSIDLQELTAPLKARVHSAGSAAKGWWMRLVRDAGERRRSAVRFLVRFSRHPYVVGLITGVVSSLIAGWLIATFHLW